MAGERRSRFDTLIQGVSFVIVDTDSVWREMSATINSRVGSDANDWPAHLDPRGAVWEALWIALHSKETETGTRQTHLQPLDGAPAFEAALGLYGELKKLIHPTHLHPMLCRWE